MEQGSVLDRLLTGGPRLSVGVITADLLRLGDELEILDQAGIELVHVDVADGVFAPLFTVGPPIVAAMTTRLINDVHLMIHDPLERIDAFVAAGADMITFQVEGVRQPHRVLQRLAAATNVNDPDRRILRGVALSPSTPIGDLEPLLDDVEYVLILGINPGWGGQSLLPGTGRRVEAARRLIDASGQGIALGIDGGVTHDNIRQVASMGADVIVSGSAVFDGRDAMSNARSMLDAIQSTRPPSERPITGVGA